MENKSTVIEEVLDHACRRANLTIAMVRTDLLKEGDEESNALLVQVSQIDELLKLAKIRFARNYMQAIDEFEGFEDHFNDSWKMADLLAHLRKQEFQIKDWMESAILQAYAIGEVTSTTEDEIADTIFIPINKDWVLYGISELYERIHNNWFVGFTWFDAGRRLVPESCEDTTVESLNIFTLYVVGILDMGVLLGEFPKPKEDVPKTLLPIDQIGDAFKNLGKKYSEITRALTKKDK